MSTIECTRESTTTISRQAGEDKIDIEVNRLIEKFEVFQEYTYIWVGIGLVTLGVIGYIGFANTCLIGGIALIAWHGRKHLHFGPKVQKEKGA